MGFSYSGDPSLSDKDAVRFEIADTNSSAPLLQDAEIDWAILQETSTNAGTPATIGGANLFSSAARCMETLARLFAAQADSQIGSLKLTYSKQADGYAKRALELRLKAQGYGAPYAGGLSVAEKQGRMADTDLIQPEFRRGQNNNPWTGESSVLTPDDLGPPITE